MREQYKSKFQYIQSASTNALLYAILYHQDIDERKNASSYLLFQKDKQPIIKTLIDHIKKDNDIAVRAAEALAVFDDKVITDTFISVLKDRTYPDLIKKVLIELKECKTDDYYFVLWKVLRTAVLKKDTAMLGNILESIKNRKEPEITSTLISILETVEDENILRKSTSILITHDSEEAISAITNLLFSMGTYPVKRSLSIIVSEIFNTPMEKILIKQNPIFIQALRISY